MNLSYLLPQEFIAQIPSEKRDEARLLVLARSTARITHTIFKEIVNLLDKRYLLVLNNTKVFPGRLFGSLESLDRGEGKVEVLLIRERAPSIWEVLARPAKRFKKGQTINFDHGDFKAEVLEDGDKKILKFNSSESLSDIFLKYCRTPLPPYIKRTPEELDSIRYQTVYAKIAGSCACPTAGLHFTEGILDELKSKGAGIVEITLHIGPGTFRPIRGDVEAHRMEEEFFVISPEAAAIINSAKRRGITIVACGTSTVRALEQNSPNGEVLPGEGWADIFILPGYRFRIVNSLITNFHQPNSSPLAMVSAFGGERLIQNAYCEAIKEKYRFLSYGDSMFII